MERPILFNAEMVKAIIDGKKTQTRRIIKPHPKALKEGCFSRQKNDFCFNGIDFDGNYYEQRCNSPYQGGDILWVRETWAELCRTDENGYTHYDEKMLFYAADGTPDIALYDADGFLLDDQRIKWHPSIHMPRKAARLFLRVTDIRVERLQDITTAGIMAEGVLEKVVENGRGFKGLWNDIYGNWDVNPWVWVIDFRKVI